MIAKENLREGIILGVVLSLIIGIIVVWITKPTFVSIVFILSLALLPGFFLMTIIHTLRISKETIYRPSPSEKFDWGVEVNLRRVQIMHSRYSSLIQTAGLIAIGSFFSMVYLANDFPNWATGNLIFFPISTVMFILSLHLMFRWWFSMRQDYKFLLFSKGKTIE